MSAASAGEPGPEPTHRSWLAFLLAAAVAASLATAYVGIPRERARLPAIARYAMKVALPRWHITEPVNEVVYGTRGFDTFGETFLLLAAVVSVIVLTRRREPRRGFIGEEKAAELEQEQFDPEPGLAPSERLARRAERAEQPEGGGRHPATPDAVPLGSPAPERAQAMTVVIRTAARLAAPVLAVAGCYLVAWGYSPGGGFPAGAVIVGVILFLYAGFGYQRIKRAIQASLVEVLELVGAFAIIVVEVLGLALKGSFSANFLPLGTPQTIRSGGILQLFSGSELFEVATGLSLALFGLIAMAHDWAPDEGKQGRRR
ncbi:MAG TPA: MnhB domain-containing protein [Gaiellaceae bacterium]